mmetsp:Transcript_12752/g.19296  ORF Transcript_12752/g.19296 Transcript_12752/m.19296 type:complete len:128 (-) Transcript_12752:22-405(-)
MFDANIGKVCQHCSRQDYLPFQCEQCHHYFCKEHWEAHQSCSTKTSLDSAKEIHPSLPAPSSNTATQCAQPSCKPKKGFQVMTFCQNCENNYCLKHRFQDQHTCVKKKNTKSNQHTPTPTCSICCIQ